MWLEGDRAAREEVALRGTRDHGADGAVHRRFRLSGVGHSGLLWLLAGIALVGAALPSSSAIAGEEDLGGRWTLLSDTAEPATRPALAVDADLAAVVWVGAEPDQAGPLRLQLAVELEPLLPQPLELWTDEVRGSPALAWTGEAFVAAWVADEPDGPVLVTAAVDRDGRALAEARRVFGLPEGELGSPSLAWSGEFLGVAFGVRGADQLLRPAAMPLDALGQPLGQAVVLGQELAPHGGPALARGEQGLLLAWTEAGPGFGLHVDRWQAPEPPQGLLILHGAQPTNAPSLAAGQDGFALAWHEGDGSEARVWARTFDWTGQARGEVVVDGSEYARDPWLVWDGEQYLLAVESGLALLGRVSAEGTLGYPLQWLNFSDGYAARGIQVAAERGRPLLAWSDLSWSPWRIVLFRPGDAASFTPPSGTFEALDLDAQRFSGARPAEPVECAKQPFTSTAWALPGMGDTPQDAALVWQGTRGVPTTAHLFMGKHDGPPGNVALRLELEARDPASGAATSRFTWTHPTYLIEAGCASRSHTIPISGLQVLPGQELWVSVTRLGDHPLDEVAGEAQLLGVRLLVQRDER